MIKIDHRHTNYNLYALLGSKTPLVVVIDPQVAGISGDMLLSALVNIGANKSKIINAVHSAENYLQGSKIQRIDFEKKVKHGTNSTQLVLEMKENYNERKGTEIQDCILLLSDKIGISDSAKVFANESIKTLIMAESKIHGEPVESVHFHEASSIDTVVDIIGSAVALDDLSFFHDEIISLPVAVGGGTLTFSHGTVSNPASAILEIFRGSDIAISGGLTKDELTTPTGAAMLVNLVTKCNEFYPQMKVRNIGYGAGKKDFDGFANVLKIVKGETTDLFQQDTVNIIETNIDDASGEVIGHMIDKLIEQGAKDVTVNPGITKKGRPTYLVSVICDSFHLNLLMDSLISETGTLGVRVRSSDRYILPRITIMMPITIRGKQFTVKCKVVKQDQVIKSFKVEADDINGVAGTLGISFPSANQLVNEEVKRNLK